MELFFRLLKLYGAAIIGYGFVFFVVLRFMDTRNFKRLSLASLITGFTLSLITFICIVIDSTGERASWLRFSFIEPYYVFLVASLALTAILSLTFLIIGIKKNQSLRSFSYKIRKDKVKAVPTVKDKKEGIYVIFSYDGKLLLKRIRVNNEDYYSSYMTYIDKKVIFHDEMIKKIINDFGLNGEDILKEKKIVGEASIDGKVVEHYYCYKLTITKVPEKLKEYEGISPYDLVNYNLNNLNKQILYHYFVDDYFKITI